MNVMDVIVSSEALESHRETAVEMFNNEAEELHLTDEERERWIWTFERLKSAEIGLTFTEKAKLYCEASTPREVELFIEEKLQEQIIIPLAA